MNIVKEQISRLYCCYLITLAACALLQDEPRHIGGLRHCNNSLMMDVVVSNIPKAISDLLVSTMYSRTNTLWERVPFSHLSVAACDKDAKRKDHQHSIFIITEPLSEPINQETY